jgi:hypothetical protein
MVLRYRTVFVALLLTESREYSLTESLSNAILGQKNIYYWSQKNYLTKIDYFFLSDRIFEASGLAK